MMKEKQIEEIAKVIGDADQRCYERDCDDCPLNTMELGLCKEKFLAIEIYNAGYRKVPEGAMILTRSELDALNKYQERFKGEDAEAVIATEVAREIFEAADEIINTICVMTGIEITAVGGKYLGLRKTYTEEEK